MSTGYRIPIRIEKRNEETEEWEEYLPLLHAKINKKSEGSEYLTAGAIQAKVSKVFEIRYCAPLKEIDGNTQLYRIIYDGTAYNITDYDDFQERHKSVKLLGVA